MRCREEAWKMSGVLCDYSRRPAFVYRGPQKRKSRVVVVCPSEQGVEDMLYFGSFRIIDFMAPGPDEWL